MRIIFTLFLACCASVANAQDIEKKELDISAKCNVYIYHLPKQLQNDTGIGVEPIVINLVGVKMISFENTSGTINFCPWNDTCYNGRADGSKGRTTTSANRGMSGIGHDKRMGFLAGVFTSSYAVPEQAPENLNVTNMENQNNWGPEMDQVFFKGDGLTEKGAVQYILVPTDADKLYLGFADGLTDYRDNIGSIHTTIVLHKITTSRQFKPSIKN